MSLEHVKGLNWHRYAQEMSTVLRQCVCMPPPPPPTRPPAHFSFHELIQSEAGGHGFLFIYFLCFLFFFREREHYLQMANTSQRELIGICLDLVCKMTKANADTQQRQILKQSLSLYIYSFAHWQTTPAKLIKHRQQIVSVDILIPSPGISLSRPGSR